VSTYFQLASYFRCMKNSITSRAFVHDTAIIKAQLTLGVSLKGHGTGKSEYVQNDIAVRTHKARNT
jgi:hypothetical protein